MPVYCDDVRANQWGLETLDELFPMAKDSQNSLVSLRHVLSLKKTHEGPSTDDFVASNYHKGTGGTSNLPAWSSDERFGFQNVTLEQVAWQNQIHKLKLPSLQKAQDAGYHHAWFFQTPVVDSPSMLQSLLAELEKTNETKIDTSQQQGSCDVDVETGVYYESSEELLDEAKKFECDTVVNCTGMGASKLCRDTELVGARGVLLVYDRASCTRLSCDDDYGQGQQEQLHDACVFADELPWGTPDLPSYMIARGDDIVIGGTCLPGDDEPTIRPHERTRLLETARLLGIDTEACQPKDEWVGFRPVRPKIRCEIDKTFNNAQSDVRLVHCYGTGGSGWTIYTGLAKEVTRLVLQ